MNTFVLIGLVLLLVGVLVANRRKRAVGRVSDTPARGASRPTRGLRRRRPDPASQEPVAVSAFPEPSPFGDPSPFGPPSPFGDPSPFAESAPVVIPLSSPETPPMPPPAHAPPPAADASDWAPHETIVEPGWPLPGEISGAWSSGPDAAPAPRAALAGAAPSVAGWETAATATATADAPVLDAEPAGAAIAEAAEAWEMPALSPLADGPAMHEAPVAADRDIEPTTPLWVPEAAPLGEASTPAWEPASSSSAPAPVWVPEAAPAAEPWEAASEEPVVPEPAAVEAVPVAPPAGVPVLAAPVAVAPVAVEPEPQVVWESAPVWAPAHDAEPEPLPDPQPEPLADLRAQSAEVAALAPAVMASLRPIARVSDQIGLTPRMLVVIGALAERPLSVTEQAAALGVSRPVVADISARLQSSGLATRERDERDRRRIQIALTERGRRIHEESIAASADDVESALARLEPADRDHLLRGLRALTRRSGA